MGWLVALKGAKWVVWLWENRAWLKWVAVGLVLAAVTGLWQWERHDRIAAEKSEKAAIERLGLAQQDAARWQQASTLRDAAIEELKGTLATQSAEIERWRLSTERANTAARDSETRRRALQAAADARIQELIEQARAHPDQVVPLGPIVLPRVDRLFE